MAAAANAAAGESFFFGKGNCVSCHLVKGRGGILGPDLTNLGRDSRLARIELALRNPSALDMAGYKLVSGSPSLWTNDSRSCEK